MGSSMRGWCSGLTLLSLVGVGACGGGGGPSSNALLANLVLSAGTLVPAFDPTVTLYTVGPALLPGAVTVTPTTAAPANVTVNGVATASGTPSGTITLPLGATAVAIVVTAEDGVTQLTYTLAIQRALTGQDAYVKASNTGASDAFAGGQVGLHGKCVAIDGDTLAVGARFEASNATGVNGNQADNTAGASGAVYVFVRAGATWVQQAYLKASNAQAGDLFGFSLDLSGDTILVGAPVEASNATGVNGNEADNSLVQAGAAYVFVRSAGVWTQQAYLKASNTDILDLFGFDVALDGDTAVIGAPQEASNATGVNGNQADNTAPSSGAVYVFVRSGATWTQQAYVKASNTEASDLFGVSVELSGDTLAAAAAGEDSNATGVNGNQADNTAALSGAVYVFLRTGVTWAQEAYVKSSNTEGGDQFGVSLALDGDTLAVGASQEDSNATGVGGNQADNTTANSGSAYVFVRSGATWTQQAYVKASNTDAGDGFGQAIALAFDTLLVGAFLEDSVATGVNGNQADNTAANSGAAYLFTRTGAVWVQTAYLKASNSEALDTFGVQVATDGSTLGVGALQEASNATGVNGNQADNSAPAAGALYLFR